MDSISGIIAKELPRTKIFQSSSDDYENTTKTPCKHGTMVTTYEDGNQRLWECGHCEDEKEAKSRDLAKIDAKRSEYFRIMFGTDQIPRRFQGKTLENFNADSSEKIKIVGICKRYVEKFDDVLDAGTSLVFCGKPGTGKTHLAYAMASQLRDRMVSAVVETASDMTAAIKEAYRAEPGQETPVDKIRKYASFDLLVVDEVGVQVSSEAEKRIFFDVINKRYEAMLPTVMISNLSLQELSDFVGERAMDRMKENGGVVIAFGWDSFRK